MAERSFIVLKYQGKVPAMASCSECQHKFFTPANFFRDSSGARQYLLGKFDVHVCAVEANRTPTPTGGRGAKLRAKQPPRSDSYARGPAHPGKWEWRIPGSLLLQ
jgi:hypothetical protein